MRDPASRLRASSSVPRNPARIVHPHGRAGRAWFRGGSERRVVSGVRLSVAQDSRLRRQLRRELNLLASARERPSLAGRTDADVALVSTLGRRRRAHRLARAGVIRPLRAKACAGVT